MVWEENNPLSSCQLPSQWLLLPSARPYFEPRTLFSDHALDVSADMRVGKWEGKAQG